MMASSEQFENLGSTYHNVAPLTLADQAQGFAFDNLVRKCISEPLRKGSVFRGLTPEQTEALEEQPQLAQAEGIGGITIRILLYPHLEQASESWAQRLVTMDFEEDE